MIVSKLATILLCAQSINGFVVKPQINNINGKIVSYTTEKITQIRINERSLILSMSQTEEAGDEQNAVQPATATVASENKSDNEKKEKKKKKKTPPPETVPEEINVSKLDVRVGIIKNAYNHETADKLYCEEIDIGEESGPRNIASGIRPYYDTPEDIIGKKVLVLANLKTRKLQGFPSHGMILCSFTDDDGVVIVEPPEDAEIGERVMVQGYDGEPATENQVIKKKMLDKIFPDLKTNDEGYVTYNGVPFETSNGGKIQGFLKNAPVS